MKKENNYWINHLVHYWHMTSYHWQKMFYIYIYIYKYFYGHLRILLSSLLIVPTF